MRSSIFHTDRFLELQTAIQELLNAREDYLSVLSIDSPRAVGDAIESVLKADLKLLLDDILDSYKADFARRAMADISFSTTDGLNYVVDVKTHRTDTKFNMPNLTSVERLAKFYEDDKNYFCILFVSYHIQATSVIVTSVRFVPIEFLDWSCLTIGALGSGQIQIANANNIVVDVSLTRQGWMLAFCDRVLDFYPKEIQKIGKRIERFELVRAFWLSQQ